MGGFGTIRGGTGGTAAGIGSAPNQIPGLLVWFCASDRESGPVVATGSVGQSIPVDFTTAGLLNRAVYTAPGSVSHGYGTAYLTPDWSGATVNTWPNVLPPASLFLACDIGINRFTNGWTFLELWLPFTDPQAFGDFRVQMAYRIITDEMPLAVTGPTIMNYNPSAGAANTGFTAVCNDDVGFVVSPTFPVVFGSGWYIVGCDGRSGATMKLRVNGVNSVPRPMGVLTTSTSTRMVWGTGGRGKLLEGCVWDRPLADAEYAAVERHWIAKYDNIHLGTVAAPVASGELRL